MMSCSKDITLIAHWYMKIHLEMMRKVRSQTQLGKRQFTERDDTVNKFSED
jgi:hypothetical protein